jgi:signal transduction histidine kinase
MPLPPDIRSNSLVKSMVSVLYVDDEECQLECCQTLLSREGSLAVDTAASAEAGLKLAGGNAYDVIVSEYQMPGMNGLDLLRALRLQGDRTPFILFTGRECEEVAMEAINAGADCIVRKGGEPRAAFAELIPAVAMAVRRRDEERASVEQRAAAGEERKREDALRLSNLKLNLLIGVTRHDILNTTSVLLAYNELLRTGISDPSVIAILDRQEKAVNTIRKQIEFTKEYDQLGQKAPQWHRVSELSCRAFSQILRTIAFRCETESLEIYADSLLEKVLYNLFDNAFRYGGGISRITLSCSPVNQDLVLVFEDDGIGIADDEKERIFRQGYGKNTGLGLFLSREILSLTGMTISETGTYRKGARFEIRIPEGHYRFPGYVAGQGDVNNRTRIMAIE